MIVFAPFLLLGMPELLLLPPVGGDTDYSIYREYNTIQDTTDKPWTKQLLLAVVSGTHCQPGLVFNTLVHRSFMRAEEI